MKVEVVTGIRKFETFELKIEIESKRELEFLWSLLCASRDDLADFANRSKSSGIKPFTGDDDVFSDVWRELNKKLDENAV